MELWKPPRDHVTWHGTLLFPSFTKDSSSIFTKRKTTHMADTISYTFRWPYGAKQSAAVGGQFSDWKEIKGEKEGDEYHIKVAGLKPHTKYLYKYIIDGVWKEDETAPTDDSEKVNGRAVVNNVLVTGASSAAERLLQTEKERDALFRQVKRTEIAAEADRKKYQETIAKLEKAQKEKTTSNGHSEASDKRVKELEEQLAAANAETEKQKQMGSGLKDINSQLLGKLQQLDMENKKEIARIAEEHRKELADSRDRQKDEVGVEKFNTDKQRQRAELAEKKLSEAREAIAEAKEALARETAARESVEAREAAREASQAKEASQAREASDSTPILRPSRAKSGSPKTSYTFRWVYGGRDVALGGDFNHWQVEPMKKDGNHYALTVQDLEPEKKYAFRYYIDGHWVHDEDAPSEALKGGQIVGANFIFTGPASSEDTISNLQFDRDLKARQLQRAVDSLEIAQKSKSRKPSHPPITVNSWRDFYNTHVLELFALLSFFFLVFSVFTASVRFVFRRIIARITSFFAFFFYLVFGAPKGRSANKKNQ
ncbi:hypothetical protein PROFUN_02259 [Planoprotostelium fungivorum]|uniref:AMP-activated protein kinase glycogen-binding domain-containing protein n=1 Tax=Planoprotostelium fungivorum TaxID=1890364 RepID=A0A2P6NYE9_9EUKA|nr:hypothetical protein PROFUN_02259 [Planoprotostelium fungivorum]